MMIRERLPAIDDSVIYKLILEEIAPFSREFNDSSVLTLTSIRKRLRNNVTFVMAKGNRRPVGFITMFCKNRVLYVDMLAISGQTQGRGLGKKLLLAGESFGKRKACKKAQLLVDESNPKAIGFYQAMGFEAVRYLAEVGCYLMEISLAASKPRRLQ